MKDVTYTGDADYLITADGYRINKSTPVEVSDALAKQLQDTHEGEIEAVKASGDAPKLTEAAKVDEDTGGTGGSDPSSGQTPSH